MLGFVACSDDDGEVIDNSETSTITVATQDITTEYCDNEDGTVAATSPGQ